MYYSDEVIDQVRSANDIVDVIGQSVPLKRGGSNYIGLCPFHNEKTPSFSVSRQKQMYYCFGCHKGGNVITFVEEYNNMNFTEAMQYLADRAGIRLPEREITAAERRSQTERSELRDVNKLAGTYYYYSLRSAAGKPGMDYLTGRGLSEGTMKSFALGFAPKTPSDGLYRFLKSKDVSDDLLRRSGLMNVDERRGTMYDKFWNRVIFPIMDTSDRIIGFGGRVMGDGKPKYLNSPETKIFDKSRNLYALNIARKTREHYLILCEGYMDVISMHQAGFTNAVASLGTSLTPGHCALLSRYTKNVILSYDSDRAGVNAALRAIPMLRRAGITPKILNLEPYKDPDEFIKALGHDAMEERLKNAQNALMFEIAAAKREYDLDDPDGKTQFFERAAGMIADLETEMERQNYIDAVSREYMVEKRMLQELVNRRLVLGAAGLGRQQGTDVPGTAEHRPGSSALRQQEMNLTDGDEEYPDEYDPQSGYDPEDPFAYYGIGQDADFYEDSATGAMYQAPPTASRNNRLGNVKQQGETISRQLLLNYITQYPAVYDTVKKYVSSDDYGDKESLTAKAAELIYEQMEKNGKVDEAAVLSRFPDASDQTVIAGLFHTLDPASTTAEREKAVRETLLKVYQAAADPSSGDLKAAVERKNKEAELRKLKIVLG